MILKIDTEKAFDTMEWSFLLNILRCFGFSNIWINWINECLSSLTFSVLLNGSPFGMIKSEGGLRQRDSLSPFLFIIGSEIFARLLQRAEYAGNLQGIKFAPRCPQITHLQFADDLLILAKANTTNVETILQCLNSYQACSGQKINLSKSEIIFSKNTNSRLTRDLCNILDLKKIDSSIKHLGLPLELNRAKSTSFNDLVEKIQNRVSGWKTKTLSQAARSTLITSVAASIPSYTMTTLQLPKKTCKIGSILCNFWWGSQTDKRPLCLKSWKSICIPKSCEGLGFHRTSDTNKALIAKLG